MVLRDRSRGRCDRFRGVHPNEACTPRIVAVARQLKFRAVVLAVWEPRSAAELDGVAELACLYDKEPALGVLVGNEGITFSRYELEDLTIAADRLRWKSWGLLAPARRPYPGFQVWRSTPAR